MTRMSKLASIPLSPMLPAARKSHALVRSKQIIIKRLTKSNERTGSQKQSQITSKKLTISKNEGWIIPQKLVH